MKCKAKIAHVELSCDIPTFEIVVYLGDVLPRFDVTCRIWTVHIHHIYMR